MHDAMTLISTYYKFFYFYIKFPIKSQRLAGMFGLTLYTCLSLYDIFFHDIMIFFRKCKIYNVQLHLF